MEVFGTFYEILLHTIIFTQSEINLISLSGQPKYEQAKNCYLDEMARILTVVLAVMVVVVV